MNVLKCCEVAAACLYLGFHMLSWLPQKKMDVLRTQHGVDNPSHYYFPFQTATTSIMRNHGHAWKEELPS
jgi:hypothetical protein